jgi:hypothetical protein
MLCGSITVAARSKARTVFARLNAGIVGSNYTRGKDVCVYSVCLVAASKKSYRMS